MTCQPTGWQPVPQCDTPATLDSMFVPGIAKNCQHATRTHLLFGVAHAGLVPRQLLALVDPCLQNILARAVPLIDAHLLHLLAHSTQTLSSVLKTPRLCSVYVEGHAPAALSLPLTPISAASASEDCAVSAPSQLVCGGRDPSGCCCAATATAPLSWRCSQHQLPCTREPLPACRVDECDPLMDACLLHCLNHCTKTAAAIKRNNEQLKAQGLPGEDPPRDQGFTRPRVSCIGQPLSPYFAQSLCVLRYFTLPSCGPIPIPQIWPQLGLLKCSAVGAAPLLSGPVGLKQ